MTNKLLVPALIAIAAALGPAGASAGLQAEKPAIETAADLPRTAFALPALPSTLVLEGGAAFERLKQEVERDARSILEGYRLDDAATEKKLRSALRQAALLDGRWRDVLDQSARIRAIEDSPAARETAGLLQDSYAEAAIAAGNDDGDVFTSAFRDIFAAKIAGMDYALAADRLQRIRASYMTLTPALVAGTLEGSMDENAAAQGMRVDRDFAATLLSLRGALDFLPLKDVITEATGAVIAANAEEKEDLWTARLVSLEGREDLTPAVIGSWDSGLDPSLFPGKMWTNEDERRNGKDDDGNGFVDDVHGIAFGYGMEPATGALRPMPEEDTQNIGALLGYVKGALDLQASVESPEADAYRKRVTELKADEVLPFSLQNARLGFYLHGSATSYTAQRDNPAARLVYSRFDFDMKPVMDPIDEAFAEAYARHIRMSTDYFREAGAKVVNMSWRMTMPQIEASLASVEADPQRRAQRGEAIFTMLNEAMTAAIESAPGVLFVAGAGNENEDVEFAGSFPAGINLPNIMTVGAVDVALEPASFTSYGRSIDVYANGFEVPSKVPGGFDINISGTSLAAPQVANLAAKLWAIDPDLSVAEVRELMESTATVEGERQLPVIDPKAAVAALAR